MRARDSVYHLSCFTCSTCNKTLTTGDHFGMKDSLVYCRAHFETLLQGEYPPQLSYTELAAKSGGLALPYFNGTGTVQKGRPRKRKSPALGVDIVNYNSGGPLTLPTPTAQISECWRRIWQSRFCFRTPGPSGQDSALPNMTLLSPQTPLSLSKRKERSKEDGRGERMGYWACEEKKIITMGLKWLPPNRQSQILVAH